MSVKLAFQMAGESPQPLGTERRSVKVVIRHAVHDGRTQVWLPLSLLMERDDTAIPVAASASR